MKVNDYIIFMGLDFLNKWMEDHRQRMFEELKKVLQEYNLEYCRNEHFANMYDITYKNKTYNYVPEYGRWQRVGQIRDCWYHSKNPRQFVMKYILNLLYDEDLV